MSDPRLTRRRFLGLAAGTSAVLAAGPLAVGRGLPAADAATIPSKGVSPGKLMYLNQWDLAQYVDTIASIVPGGWVRTDIDWEAVERTPGVFDWTAPDRAVNAAVQRGLRVIAILGTAPAWANGGLGSNFPPLTPSSMAAFFRGAAARYGPLGVVFEIWNEPNFSASWRWPDAAKYTALLKVAYAEIKQASPSSIVMTGGLASGGSPGPVEFLRTVYANGGRASFDAVGYHPYCGTSAPLGAGSGFLATQDLHATMADNGDAAKQVWGTEVGWRVELLGVTDAMQASYLTQAYTQWAQWFSAGWVGPLLWYNLRDSSLSLLDQHSQYGLFHNDWSARPAYWALKNS